jgi:hypothetical protein
VISRLTALRCSNLPNAGRTNGVIRGTRDLVTSFRPPRSDEILPSSE